MPVSDLTPVAPGGELIWKLSFPDRDYYVPKPYFADGQHLSKERCQELLEQGLAFTVEDLEYPEDAPGDGVVRRDSTMVVLFCDMKGSTEALVTLGGAFRQLQAKFFRLCEDTVKDANNGKWENPKNGTGDAHNAGPAGEHADDNVGLGRPCPVTVIDKFVGDGLMLYVDCGPTTELAKKEPLVAGEPDLEPEVVRRGTRMAAWIIREIASKFEGALKDAVRKVSDSKDSSLTRDSLTESTRKLGLRFGVALGDGIMLSVLGEGTVTDFTLTGAIVNLAARLEHATAPEFLEAIAARRGELSRYTGPIEHEGALRGSQLHRDLVDCDRQVVDVHTVTAQRFQIRANERVVNCLKQWERPIRLAWCPVPFEAKGFSGAQTAFIVAGKTAGDLFASL